MSGLFPHSKGAPGLNQTEAISVCSLQVLTFVTLYETLILLLLFYCLVLLTLLFPYVRLWIFMCDMQDFVSTMAVSFLSSS